MSSKLREQRISEISESELIEFLEPIRFFFLAKVIHFFLSSGLYRALYVASTQVSVPKLSSDLRLDENRLKAIFQYLRTEDYITYDGQLVGLTAKGRALEKFEPWYNLLVGGYSITFDQLSDLLQNGDKYGSRSGAWIGLGSCGISAHDALPMTLELLRLEGQGIGVQTIVDLGCGDGSYLIEICERMGLKGIGLDPEESSVLAAHNRILELGCEETVCFHVGNAIGDFELAPEAGPFCFLTAFVLQELLEQEGREAVLRFMSETINKYPDASWVVIEVDNKFDDSQVMSQPLSKAYYNAYYLIHNLTCQRLESDLFWVKLFEDAGLRIVARSYPKQSYDSLKLKMGYLLRKSESQFDSRLGR